MNSFPCVSTPPCKNSELPEYVAVGLNLCKSFAVLVDELELLQGFDDVDVVPEVDDHVFGALVQTVVQNGQTLRTETFINQD